MFAYSRIYPLLQQANEPLSFAYLCQELRQWSNKPITGAKKEELRDELQKLYNLGVIEWDEKHNEYSLPTKEANAKHDDILTVPAPSPHLEGYTDANLAKKIVGLSWSTAEEIAEHIDLEKRFVAALEERLHNIVDHRQQMLSRKFSKNKKQYLFSFY